jgi:hypothetical protein
MVLKPDQTTIALKHRLGLPLSDKRVVCRPCAKVKNKPPILDRLGHHALSCSTDGKVTTRHNALVTGFHKLASRAQFHPQLELGPDGSRRRNADILLPAYKGGQAAACDFTVVSPLKMEIFSGAGASGNRAMEAVKEAEAVKHRENEAECEKEDWLCVPVAVDYYGVWGEEARELFSNVATNLSYQMNMSKSKSVCAIYNFLGIILARHNAVSVLSKLNSMNFAKPEV